MRRSSKCPRGCSRSLPQQPPVFAPGNYPSARAMVLNEGLAMPSLWSGSGRRRPPERRGVTDSHQVGPAPKRSMTRSSAVCLDVRGGRYGLLSSNECAYRP